MRNMLQGLGTLSPLTLLTVITGLVQAKLLAVLLGPHGTGFYFLTLSFLNLLTTIVGLGMQSSVTKLVAEFLGTDRRAAVWPTVGLALGSVTVLGAVVGGLTVVGRDLLAGLFLGSATLTSEQRAFVFTLAAVGILPTCWHVTMNSTLKGMRSLKEYAIAGSLSIMALTLCILGGAWLFGTYGALFGSVVGQAASLAIFGLFVVRVARREGLRFSLGIRRQETLAIERRLVALGLLALVAVLAGSLGQNMVRSQLAVGLGLGAVAFFSAAWSISNQLPLMIYQTFSAYSMPRISSFGQNWPAITAEQNHALRLGLLAVTPVLCLVIVSLESAIPLLFTHEFLGMIGLLRWMLVGELISVVLWATSMALYPSGRAFHNAVAEWSWWGVFLVAVLVGMQLWGLEAVGWAYTLAYSVMALAIGLWERHHHGFAWSSENRQLLMFSIAAVLAALLISQLVAGQVIVRVLLMMSCLGAWGVYSIKAQEREALRKLWTSLSGFRKGEA